MGSGQPIWLIVEVFHAFSSAQVRLKHQFTAQNARLHFGFIEVTIIVDEIEGQFAFYNGNMPELACRPLNRVEENTSFALFNDTSIEIRFSIDDTGRAFAMTIAQEGLELKLPRKN